MIDPPTYRHRGGSIIEFETSCEVAWGTVPPVIAWRGKIAIDLRWIGSAQPYGFYDDQMNFTNITLCGSDTGITINIPYEDFMVLWMAAK